MGRLDGSLGDRVRHEEEVKPAVDNFGLLDEAAVHVGALRRVGDVRVAGASVVAASVRLLLLVLNLEEPLADALVDDDQGRLGEFWLLLLVFLVLRLVHFGSEGVLLLHDLVELLQLVLDDLSPHGIADTVSVNEDVIGQLALVVVSECLEGILEVLLQHAAADDFLALLPLRAGLGVVLAHVLVVGGAEADDGLLTFVADINTHEHGLF